MDPNMGLNFVRGLCNGPEAGNELKKGPNSGPVLDFFNLDPSRIRHLWAYFVPRYRWDKTHHHHHDNDDSHCTPSKTILKEKNAL